MRKYRSFVIVSICLSLLIGCFANLNTASAASKSEVYTWDDTIWAARSSFGLVAKNVTNVKIGNCDYQKYGWTAYITQKNKNVVKAVDFFHKKPQKQSNYKLQVVSKKGENFYPLFDSLFTLDKKNRLLYTGVGSCYLFENHKSEQECKKSYYKEKVYEVVEKGLNAKKIWTSNQMIAYVKNNNLYITGYPVSQHKPTPADFSSPELLSPDEPYDARCYEYDKPRVFFEGQGNKVKDVICGDSLSGNIYVLLKDGSVWAMGKNNNMKLISNSKQKYFYDFVKILSGGAKKISANQYNVAVIKSNGDLYVWGHTMKSSGSKKYKPSHKPTKIADNVKEVSCTESEGSTLVFLKKNGTAYAMGAYEVETNKYISGWSSKPVKLMSNVKHIYTGANSAVLLLKKNKDLYWAGSCYPEDFSWVEKKLSKK